MGGYRGSKSTVTEAQRGREATAQVGREKCWARLWGPGALVQKLLLRNARVSGVVREEDWQDQLAC